ncbi:MAG TPA: hypothetical protein DD850_15605 [Erwinia persicina]|nr:hypothetical protein [Erwinia persicina]
MRQTARFQAFSSLSLTTEEEITALGEFIGLPFRLKSRAMSFIQATVILSRGPGNPEPREGGNNEKVCYFLLD